MRVSITLLTVLLTLATSIFLDQASEVTSLLSYTGVLVVFFVFILNAIKFFIWGWLNKRFDLSRTYPLTSLFFPLIFLYALLSEEAVFDLQKLLGLVIILGGVYVMESSKGINK